MVRSDACLFVTLLLIGGCTVDHPEQPQDTLEPAAQPQAVADWVFTNAKVYTLDSTQPWANAVAISDNKITFVGSDAGAQGFIGDSTTRIDLAGRVLLPGFIDTHVHPLSGGAYAAALSLDTFADVEAWVAAIADYAQSNPAAEVIFGYGFLATTFGPAGPDKKLIDAVVADRPVLIMDEGFHAAWANSAALDVLGIGPETIDPQPGYSYYKRDQAGEPTGYLLEGTAGSAMDKLDVITAESVIAGTKKLLGAMNGYGVTSAFDAGALIDPAIVERTLEQLEQVDALSIRLVGAFYPSNPDAAQAAATAVADTLKWRDQMRGERYHYNTLKIPYDGTVEGRTAAMFEDYQGEPGNKGETLYSLAELDAMIVGATEHQLDVHVHALGERAVHNTLNAIEKARETYPGSVSRYTICHIQVVADSDVPRFAELDVIAQSTPLWASFDTYGKPFVSEDQFNRFWQFRSIEQAGARLTFGSDFPASGAGTLGLSPLLQIEIGHTRQLAGSPDAPIQPPVSERLSIASLIRGFTLDAAYQIRKEDELGSIEVGKLADLIVLDANPFEIDPYRIHSIGVALTMLGGEVVHFRASDPDHDLIGQLPLR